MTLWFLFAIIFSVVVYAQEEDINNNTTTESIIGTNSNNEGVCNINEGCCQCTNQDDTSTSDYEEEEATTIRIL